MGSDWEDTTLGSLLGFSNGKKSPDRDQSSGLPVYGANGIIGFSDNVNSEENTLIVGRVGSYCGSVYFSKKKCWVTDNAIRAISRGNNNPEFLFYLLKNLNLNSLREGSGQPLLNQAILKNIDVLAPLPSEQKAIAHILGSLDDKIELNRQMNETLESMAQALFKSWFVDFDPVIDNTLAAGNSIPDVFAERAEQRREIIANAKKASKAGESFKSSENNHQALFPSEFEFTEEMGWIPKGWNSTTLGDFVIFGNGKTSPDRISGNIPVFGSNGQIGLCDEFNRNNTIIIGRVGSYCGSLQYYPSKCWITDNAMSANMETMDHNIFLYQLLSRDNLNDRRTGSGQPLLNQSILRSIRAIIPTTILIGEYSRVSNDFFLKKAALNKSSSTLEGVRDTLLPKLLSGELRIPDVEKLIDEANA